MTHVRLSNVNVRIPIYDSHALRLLRLPSFGTAKVGTDTASRSRGVMVMHALKDINLDLEEGDRVCLIGHNGAGKTTLLRVIAGIYPPDTGTITVSGVPFALLGGTMALTSDATGYENIRLMAALYDWPQETYAAIVKDIEEFAELGDYLSLPVRIYSAGMHARLAFALATAQPPDILLIDENIGAGDAHFQEKAQKRVQDFVNRARIMLLASHSIALCRAMCNKALVLRKGEIEFFGDLETGFSKYEKMAV